MKEIQYIVNIKSNLTKKVVDSKRTAATSPEEALSKLYFTSRMSSRWVFRNIVKDVSFFDNEDSDAPFNSGWLTALVKESVAKVKTVSEIDETDLEKARFILSKVL